MMVIVLLTNQLANGTLYLNVFAFVPLYIQKNYAGEISVSMASFSLCAFELAALISAKIHQMTISKMGRKNAVILSYLLLILSTTGLGLLDLVDKSDWKLFIALLTILRFVQGYADSLSISS